MVGRDHQWDHNPGTLHRDLRTSSNKPPKVQDPPNQQSAPPPRWFKQMGAKVRIVRNQFVACEITAKIDIQTAAEDRLQAGMPSGRSGTLGSGQAWEQIPPTESSI